MTTPVTQFIGAPLVACLLAVAIASGPAPVLSAAEAGPQASVDTPTRYSALAVRTVGVSGTLPVEMIVSRWTTQAEHDALLVQLTEGGQDAMLDAMATLPDAGRLTTPGSVGFAFKYATRTRDNGTERVTILTERNLSFFEASERPRSTDYRFLLIEFSIGPSGEGKGRLLTAAQLGFNSAIQTLVVEHYETQPMLLQGVRRAH